MRATTFASLLLLVSCRNSTSITSEHRADASSEPSQPGNVTGTRLKARTYVGEDGSKEFVGWHDSQLKLNCTIQPNPSEPNGALRCLPAFAVPLYFSDAACTQRLAGAPKQLGVPTIALECKSWSCSTKCDCGEPATKILAIAGPHSGTAYQGGDGTPCSAVAPSGAGDMNLYVTGAEVPPTTYVAATEQLL
jgi:hypothetical protein